MSPVAQVVAHCALNGPIVPSTDGPASVVNTKQQTWPEAHWLVSEHAITDPVHELAPVQPFNGGGVWLWSPQQHT
jgi:hypothetical protein